ncbi:MAG: mechanosensitive ion channel [Spirochaetales bacterium]|nr:mechanosensitive ion channel [Spirochaetales bacterium]
MIDLVRAFLTSPLELGGIRFSFSLLDAVLQFALPIVALFVAQRLILSLLVRRLILGRLKISDQAKEQAYRRTRLVLRIVVSLAVLFVVLGFFGAEMGRYLARAWEVLTTPFATAGSSRISVITIVLAIPVFFLASWVSKLAKRFLDSTVLHRVGISDAVRFTLSSLLRYGILILAVLIGLSFIGINLSSLTVLFGVLGIGLGFGLQNVVANYVAGLIIFFERPVKEGDRIVVEGVVGDVVQIRLRSTVINTLTNETIIVPNSNLVSSPVHNYSHEDKRIVVESKVQVAYGTDLDQAVEVLQEVGSRNPYGVSDPPPRVLVLAFADSGIELALWTWIELATNKVVAASWSNLEIWRAFRKAGIVIPFPQVDLHVIEPVELRTAPSQPKG